MTEARADYIVAPGNVFLRPVANFIEGSNRQQVLAKKMASSWANFAATGNPSLPDLAWSSTDPESNKTMIWDNHCRMADDPDGEARTIIQT
ncbi:MAG: hypothetical protein ACLGXA_24695 [Acidobacteriota bacterium]